MYKAVKIYSTDWRTREHMSYAEAVRRLKRQGINTVMVLAGMEAGSAAGSYEPRAFRDALGEAGITYWSVCNQFYDPQALERFGSIPVDQDGLAAVQQDWYLGACPTAPAYLEAKRNETATVMETLDPDGIFLGFHRFPGFWETWLPDVTEEDWQEFCFCSRCLRLFRRDTGAELPQAESMQRLVIRENLADCWTQWKCSVIHSHTENLRRITDEQRPGLPLILNTLPFSSPISRRYFGQDAEKLSDLIDIFELMAYHQILDQDAQWVIAVSGALKAAVKKPVVTTVQARPAYLDGFHAGRGRRRQISSEEWNHMINGLPGLVDGIAVFEWGQLLDVGRIFPS